MFLSKEAILATDAGQIEIVPVPEWGGDVRVMAMDAERLDAFEMAGLVQTEDGQFEMSRKNVRARVCAFSIVDEDGGLMFTPSDIALLGRKDGAALTRIFQVAQRLSKLRPDAVETEKND